MKMLPRSPRVRRRLARAGAVLAVVAAVAGLVVALPRGHETVPSAVAADQTPIAPEPRQVRLTRADHAAIDRTLDRFVPRVVARRDLAAGYDVVTPAMREGQTRAEWSRSDPPVQLVRAVGRRFHAWTLTYAFPGEANVSLQLHQRGPGPEAITFDVDLRRVGGRWLVDSIAPAAIFGNDTVSAAADFGAQGSNDVTTTEARLSGAWIALPVAIILLLPFAAWIGWFTKRLWRRRRLSLSS